jgi:hypothetical protein
LLDRHVGEVFELDIAGNAGADLQLADFVFLELQHGGWQAIEQVIQEHHPKRSIFARVCARYATEVAGLSPVH